jgi:ribonuclease HI
MSSLTKKTLGGVIHAYTDGACKGNPGRGGWGWVQYSSAKTVVFVDYGGERNTTNQRMELKAVIEYLKSAETGKSHLIHSDSKYVLEGLVKGGTGDLTVPGRYTGWLSSMLAKDFKGYKNIEYWKAMDVVIRNHLKNGSKLSFKHVRGHVGIPGNELADKMANRGVEESSKLQN